MTGTRELLFRAILVTSSLLCVFIILEVGARVFLPPQQTVEVPDVQAVPIASGPRVELESEERLDPIMQYGPRGVRLRPNTRAVIKNHLLSKQDVLIETNELGLRSASLSEERSIGAREFRILVLGDSITFGDYVQVSDTYPQLLEQQLRSAGKSNARVINAGLPGASLSEEYYHYREIRDSVKPKLVLVGLYLNDSQNTRNFYMRSLQWPWSKSRIVSFLSTRVDFLRARLWVSQSLPEGIDPNWREEFRAGRSLHTGDMFNDQQAMDYEVYNAHADFGLAWHPRSWELLEKLLISFRSDVEGGGGSFGVFLFPVHYQIRGSGIDRRPQQFFAEVCRKNSLICLDLLEPLREAWHVRNVRPLLYDHCHYTAEGNREVANALLPWLQSQFELD